VSEIQQTSDATISARIQTTSSAFPGKNPIPIGGENSLRDVRSGSGVVVMRAS